jgi:methanogenic corrinoid protein MtbC1
VVTVGHRGFVKSETEKISDRWTATPGLRLDWGSSQTPRTGASSRKALAGIIENDIIPRLLRTHEDGTLADLPSSGLTGAERVERIEEFTEVVLQPDIRPAMEYFDMLRLQGASIEILFNELLAPTARRLGELWERDIRDFTEVTRGVDHIQQIVMAYCSAFCNEVPCPQSSRRILLMTLPGERHNLGVCIIRAHFWREGWDVWCDTPQSLKDLAKLVKSQWFDVLGFSATRVSEPDKLGLDIKNIRKASINEDLTIIVGGHAFFDNHKLVASVGADGTAVDGRQAVKYMSERLRERRL